MLDRRVLIGCGAVATMLAPVGAASAQGTVTADLAPTATMVSAGEAAEIEVTVTCPKKHEVLEAFIYISQGGRTSQFSGIGIRKCKENAVSYTVLVRPFADTLFQPGEASASSYVLVSRPDGGGTISGGEFQEITIL